MNWCDTLAVPSHDWLCRLVKTTDWNFEAGRPSPTAFRASSRRLSLWHVEQIEREGCTVQDLCINAWLGAGEAHLQARDFIDAAKDSQSPVFSPRVFWRPDSTHPDWAAWRSAHVEVESEAGRESFPQPYRVALVLRADPERLRPPTAG